jgi:hypothetical protein
MPNWCSNFLALSHEDPRMIARARRAFRQGRLLDSLVPLPESQKENWYDWHVSNWGTKWDVGHRGGDNRVDANTVEFTFDSAWSPPTAWYEKILDQGFTVRAYYYESGMCFAGVWDNGDDDHYELSNMNSDEVRDLLPDDVNDFFGISEVMAEYEEMDKDEVTEWYESGVEECKLEPHTIKGTT